MFMIASTDTVSFQSTGYLFMRHTVRLGFGPQDWNLSLETEIRGGDWEEGEGEGGESSPYVWKHRSLTPSGPLPKNDENG